MTSSLEHQANRTNREHDAIGCHSLYFVKDHLQLSLRNHADWRNHYLIWKLWLVRGPGSNRSVYTLPSWYMVSIVNKVSWSRRQTRKTSCSICLQARNQGKQIYTYINLLFASSAVLPSSTAFISAKVHSSSTLNHQTPINIHHVWHRSQGFHH